MNRLYINEVKFKHEPIKLRRPVKEKPEALSQVTAETKRHSLRVLFIIFLIVAGLFTANFVIVSGINFLKGSHFVTVIDAFKDYQEFMKTDP
jgi:predicted RND superfamily exporter protein